MSLALTKLGNAKERSLRCDGWEVRAILENRKTVIRRIIPGRWWRCIDPEHDLDDAPTRDSVVEQCPYGQPFDYLWVRENFCTCYGGLDSYQIIYAADGARKDFSLAIGTTDGQLDWLEKSMNVHGELGRPAIHLPRWASRILLEVVSVRVERLQEITEEDARAEGSYLDRCPCLPRSKDRTPLERAFSLTECHIHGVEFKTLWNQINAKRGYSWASNPYVWRIEFKRIKP